MEHYGDFFDTLYQNARTHEEIAWIRLQPNPQLIKWARRNTPHIGGKAAVVGCGLGDDAEFLQQIGFETTAFDISAEAIAAAKARFPQSHVRYERIDLFALDAWMLEQFDFVFEAYTLQSLPNASRALAIDATASLLKPGGRMLVLCLANLKNLPNPPGPPHPVRKTELDRLLDFGFEEHLCEVYENEKGMKEYRIVYKRTG